MDADRRGQAGQSMLELLLMMPVMFTLVIILIRVNQAIQVSIVDQKYAREQTLFIVQNSSIYPRIEHRYGPTQMITTQANQMILGVADNIDGASEDTDFGSTAGYHPKATTQFIARSAKPGADQGEGQEEPDKRVYVRVRNTVSLCTQSNVVQGAGGQILPLSAANLLETGFTPNGFLYCKAPNKLGMEPL